jgi:acyl-CoA synthetase (NDP forming)
MTILNLNQSVKLCEKNGIKFAKYAIAKNEGELEKACHKLGFPVAMKIISHEITHKSDVGGVAINIKSFPDAKKVFEKFSNLPGFEGAFVQEMISGNELIIGGKTDPQFGHVLLFGMGGIYTEILKDFSLRICPAGRDDIRNMISEIKSYPVLAGARGKQKINFAELEHMLMKVSNMLIKEKITELDLNPVFANSKHVLAVDARVSK